MQKVLLLLAILIFSISSNAQEKKSTAVTVYNNDLGVIKEIRNINIQSGVSNISITDVAERIDPTSVHIKLNGEVIEQNYQYDLVNMFKILQKYINKNIELTGKDNELISGDLLSAQSGQIVLRKDNGGILMIPDLANYRISTEALPEGLITRPTLIWKVKSNLNKNQDVEISYQTKGMDWHAEYVGVLNENDSKIDLKSWVSVTNNSGTTYKDAKLKLVAGDVNLIQDQPEYLPKRGIQNEMALAADKQFEEKSFFEYHIYDLQRNTDIANNETKQISLFDENSISITKKYLYRSGSPYYYRYANSGNNKVAVAIQFENKKNNNLGVPMPKGKVRLYKSDGSSIEFIGEDLIDHTPKNEVIKLKIGDAFDILAEEIQTESKRISDKVYENAWEIKLTNRKDENVMVEVEKYLGNNWEVVSSSFKYEKVDAYKILFKVPVDKDSESVLKIKVRYVY